MKTKEEILNEFGCPPIPFDENVTMYYPAILSAMDEYASQFRQEWIPVAAVQDDSGHWYVMPKELYQTFRKDLNDEHFIDSGKFGETYGQYITGGDLNLTQLYIPNPTKS